MSLTADEYKQQGNAAFTAKDYDKAIELFTKAIEVSETPNHVLYSNRSACYTSLKKFSDALNDANECVKINPSWSKGYNRLGAAHLGLGDRSIVNLTKISYVMESRTIVSLSKGIIRMMKRSTLLQ